LVYRTGDRVLAEDLLADTFERVFRTRRGFDGRRGSEKTWLYTIGLNCLRDQARRRAAEGRALERVEVVPEAQDFSVASERIEDNNALNAALRALSGDERVAIALRYGADLTVPEIARVVKEPLTTIEGRVYRALRKLRDELAEDQRPARASARILI
jgi:RNA polymerase sigma-70 factor (ECF subfamily)